MSYSVMNLHPLSRFCIYKCCSLSVKCALCVAARAVMLLLDGQLSSSAVAADIDANFKVRYPA